MKMIFVGNLPDYRWKEIVCADNDGPTDPALDEIWNHWRLLWLSLNKHIGYVEGMELMTQEVELRSRMIKGWK